jgi:hypothetical protein
VAALKTRSNGLDNETTPLRPLCVCKGLLLFVFCVCICVCAYMHIHLCSHIHVHKDVPRTCGVCAILSILIRRLRQGCGHTRGGHECTMCGVCAMMSIVRVCIIIDVCL